MTIHIKRRTSSINKQFKYKLFTDKKILIGEISSGQDIQINIPQDTEYIIAKLMWCSSNKLFVSQTTDGQEIILTENTFFNKYIPYSGSILPLTIILTNYYPSIQLFVIILISAYLLFIVSILTIFKNRWLALNKSPAANKRFCASVARRK